MKEVGEIINTPGMYVKKKGPDGFGGTVFPIEYKKGKMKVVNDVDKALHFIFSWGCGLEHLSVSTPIKTPTWEQMCFMKDIFWRDDEVCMQLHPKRSDYVNNMQYCLQPTFILAPDLKYRADFIVFNNDGTTEIIDVKRFQDKRIHNEEKSA